MIAHNFSNMVQVSTGDTDLQLNGLRSYDNSIYLASADGGNLLLIFSDMSFILMTKDEACIGTVTELDDLGVSELQLFRYLLEKAEGDRPGRQ